MKLKVTCIIISIIILVFGGIFVYKTYIDKSVEDINSVQSLDDRKIYLNLQEDIYYPVHVPKSLSFSTDNSKYIEGDGECFTVSVVSGIDPYKFSESMLINDAATLTKNIIISKDWDKVDVMEAAVYIVDDKAIKISVQKGMTEEFATIVKGFERETVTKSKYTRLITTDSTIGYLPEFKGNPEVHAGLGESLSTSYTLGDGTSYITVSRELRKFEDAVKIYEQRIANIADSNIASCYYLTDNIFYVEVDNYVVGIYKVNYNTVLTCFGYGEEAKNNTVFFLTNQD